MGPLLVFYVVQVPGHFYSMQSAAISSVEEQSMKTSRIERNTKRTVKEHFNEMSLGHVVLLILYHYI